MSETFINYLVVTLHMGIGDLCVTHVASRPAEPDAWVQAIYFVKDSQDYKPIYRIGLKGTFPKTEEEVFDRVKRKGMIPVNNPAKIEDGQAVWLTPDYEFYVARKDNPVDDPDKVLIHSKYNSK